MDKRKVGQVQVRMYEESAQVFKKAAEKAGLTLPMYFAHLVDSFDGTHRDTQFERDTDSAVNRGDFKRTGRGVAKSGGEFRELDIYSKDDEAMWLRWRDAEPYREDGQTKWQRYMVWWEERHPGRFWESNGAFFPTSLRC